VPASCSVGICASVQDVLPGIHLHWDHCSNPGDGKKRRPFCPIISENEARHHRHRLIQIAMIKTGSSAIMPIVESALSRRRFEYYVI